MTTSSPDQSPIEIIINTTLKQALTIDRPVNKPSPHDAHDADDRMDDADLTTDNRDATRANSTTITTATRVNSANADTVADQKKMSVTASESQSDTQESTIVSTRRHLAVAGALIRTISQTAGSTPPESSTNTRTCRHPNTNTNSTDVNCHDGSSSTLPIEPDAERIPMPSPEADTNTNTNRDQATPTPEGSLLSALLTSTMIAHALNSSMNHASDPWNPSSLDFYQMSSLFRSDRASLIITGAAAACRRFDVEVKTVASRAQIPYETLTEHLKKSE